MGRYRQVFDRVWVDEWFRGLPDDARLLWFYLLTCEHWFGSLPGLFRCRAETMAADIGWSVEKLRSLLAPMVESGRLKMDDTTGLVWVVHAHSYLCPQEKITTMETNWPRMVQMLPECRLREEAWSSISESVARKKSSRSRSCSGSGSGSGSGSSPHYAGTVPAPCGNSSGTLPEDFLESPGSVRDTPPALMQDHRPMGPERDILLEACEEYGRVWHVVPPDLPTGDHQRRFLGVLRDSSGGRDVLLAAVRGHHRRASPDGAKVGRELRHVVPPATEHGRSAPHRPDMTRVLEYAAADPRRRTARAAAPERPPAPEPAPPTPEEAEAAERRMAEFRRMMAERRSADAAQPPAEDRAARIAREKAERVAAEAELREHAARRTGG